MINLRITEEQFNHLYPDLVGYYDFFDQPPPAGISDEDFERRYLSNKLWRLNNCYKVTDKWGNVVVFRMNVAQHTVYAASRLHPRVIILKSRQQGISTFWLLSYFDDGLFAPNLNIGMMAQGVDEASSLLERSKFTWENLSDGVKQFANVRLLKDNAKEFTFSNGSSIIIRVSFRSSALQRLHVSEMGKIANSYPIRAREVKTGTLQALGRGNTGIIESTAEGMNMFKEMWDDAVTAKAAGVMSAKDFYPVFLSWLDDNDCLEEVDQPVDSEAAKYFEALELETGRKLTKQQKNFWIVQRRELAGELFQEYPATPREAFTLSKDGTYWNRQFQELVVGRGRIVKDLYDPNLPVDVYMDIGVDDYCVLVFKQWYQGDYLIIDEYWNRNFDLAHYMDEAMSRGYRVRSIRFPHDVRVREFGGGNTGRGGRARTRIDIAREKASLEGWDVILDEVAKVGIADGVEAVRRILPNMYIDSRCSYLIKCFNRYSKEYDERLQAFKKTEKHDEWSHGAAAVRYMAVDSVENEGSIHDRPVSARRNTSYAL